MKATHGIIKHLRSSQSIKTNIRNQLIQSISIADCRWLLSAIKNNQTHRNMSLLIATDWQKSITTTWTIQRWLCYCFNNTYHNLREVLNLSTFSVFLTLRTFFLALSLPYLVLRTDLDIGLHRGKPFLWTNQCTFAPNNIVHVKSLAVKKDTIIAC